MKEVENVTKDGMDIINRVKEIVAKMKGKIDDLKTEIERIDVDYADRSEQHKLFHSYIYHFVYMMRWFLFNII